MSCAIAPSMNASEACTSPSRSLTMVEIVSHQREVICSWKTALRPNRTAMLSGQLEKRSAQLTVCRRCSSKPMS